MSAHTKINTKTAMSIVDPKPKKSEISERERGRADDHAERGQAPFRHAQRSQQQRLPTHMHLHDCRIIRNTWYIIHNADILDVGATKQDVIEDFLLRRNSELCISFFGSIRSNWRTDDVCRPTKRDKNSKHVLINESKLIGLLKQQQKVSMRTCHTQAMTTVHVQLSCWNRGRHYHSTGFTVVQQLHSVRLSVSAGVCQGIRSPHTHTHRVRATKMCSEAHFCSPNFCSNFAFVVARALATPLIWRCDKNERL